MASAAYSELELQYARPLAQALIHDDEFRHWALSGTRRGELARTARHNGELQRLRRGQPKMKNPYWFNYWCGKDRLCTCRIGTAIETDILLVFACEDGTDFSIHVEVKRPGDGLGDGQAATYPRRAACWASDETRPKRILPHNAFVTMLACGANLAGNPELVHFDKVVFHDDIAKRLQPYPEL